MTVSQAVRRPKRVVTSKQGRFVVASLLFIVAIFASFASNVEVRAQSKSQTSGNELSPVASFINDKTLFVARFDVEKVDSERLGETLQDLFKQILTTAGLPESSVESSAKEFQKTVATLKKDFVKFAPEFKNENGFSQVYYVIQTVKGEGACFIIPSNDLSEEQIAKIKETATSLGLNCALYQKKFIVASSAPLKEIGTFYKNFKPSKNPQIDEFFNSNADKMFAFYSGRIKIRPLFQTSDADVDARDVAIVSDDGEIVTIVSPSTASLGAKDDSVRNRGKEIIAESENRVAFLLGGAFGRASRKKARDPFEAAPTSVKNAVETFDSSFVAASGYFDANALKFSMNLKFTSPANAAKFKEEWQKVNDEVIPMVYKDLEGAVELLSNPAVAEFVSQVNPSFQAAPVELLAQYRLLPLFRELTVGEARVHSLRQSGAQLSFTFDASDEIKKIGPNTISALVLTATLSNWNNSGLKNAVPGATSEQKVETKEPSETDANAKGSDEPESEADGKTE